jgi:hypothetical protein
VGLVVLSAGLGCPAAFETITQIGGVIKARVMGSNKVREQPAGGGAKSRVMSRQAFEGMESAGCRVGLAAPDNCAAFDVSIFILPDVLLKSGPELAEIVPKAREIGPRLSARRRKLPSKLGDRSKVINQIMVWSMGNEPSCHVSHPFARNDVGASMPASRRLRQK